jgi:hypothetical protein
MSKTAQTPVWNPDYPEESLKIQKGGFMTPHQVDSWGHPVTQANKEMDPEKLMNLVTELNGVLGKREETSRKQQHRGNGPNSYRACA